MINPVEHELNDIHISPDQFLDCSQAIIHTILFHRCIDKQVTPKSVIMNGLDIAYATAEDEESSENIRKRLLTMQKAVFNGLKKPWIILSLMYSIPKKNWFFRESQSSKVWERWVISFTFSTLPAKEIRKTMLDVITKIILKSNSCKIASREKNENFTYSLNIETDKDWEAAREVVNLFKRVVKTPAGIFP